MGTSNWARVADSKAIYVGIVDRAEFDQIAVQQIDHGAKATGHCLSKTVENSDGVMVIFQHWIELPKPEAA